MHSSHVVLLTAFLLVNWSIVATSTSFNAAMELSCDRVALGSQSAVKWTVGCITDTATASSAYFSPLLVKNFYAHSGTSVVASASDLNLSSSFARVDALVSPTVTTFVLLAALGYQPQTPVSIASTAFAELSALQTLRIEGIPLSDSNLHLVLPASVQNISIVNCGLRNFSIEFADDSPSSISSIDLRQNNLHAMPAFVYELPTKVSTINLRRNLIDFSTATSAHKKQLKAWLDVGVLQLDRALLQGATSSIVGTAKAMESTKDVSNRAISASSRESETASTMQQSRPSLVGPIAIVALSLAVMLAIGITLAIVVQKRRHIHVRGPNGILDVPHPFDKGVPVRSESSTHVTAIESERSQSRMSSGEESKQEIEEDRDTCFIVPMSPTGSELSFKTTANLIHAGYFDLQSPQAMDQPMLIDRSRHEPAGRDPSLQLLSPHSTASLTATDQRMSSRHALRAALTTLLATKRDDARPLLTVNTFQYSFDPETRIEETTVAFFIPCRLMYRSMEDTVSGSAPLPQRVLKVFIEEDSDLARRERYALQRLHHDDASGTLVSRLFDDALDYELRVGHVPHAITSRCCILVLENLGGTTLQTHVALACGPPEQHVWRAVQAVRALHSHCLVHGALDTNLLLATTSADQSLRFWGLEHVSSVGQQRSCFNPDMLEISQAECIAPEAAAHFLENTVDSCAAMSLDIWSLGVMILKIYASRRPLEEFKDCTNVLERLCSVQCASNVATLCFFERSIAQFVPNQDMKDLLRQCLHYEAVARPSIDSIATHKVFQPQEREVSRATTATKAATLRMLSAMVDDQRLLALRKPTKGLLGIEPEPGMSGKEVKSTEPDQVARTDVTPEPLPPSLWLFLPPVELDVDLTKRASCYSVDQWVGKLQRLQQQRAEDLRFPLVFMCETCESGAAIPCSIATATKYGVSVSSSLLSLVMPLVRETMLFLEARAILSNGLSVGEASGLTGPQQWEELRAFYSALERMEIATVNPVNEIEFAPIEQQLKSQDQAKAHAVLDQLTMLNFSEDKREYVRSLLDALVSDNDLMSCIERSSWAALRRCEVSGKTSSSHTRWLCSHHAPLEN